MSSFNFIGPTYQSQNLSVDAERCVNMYPELIEAGPGASQATKYALYGTPGLAVWCTLPDANIRCIWAGNPFGSHTEFGSSVWVVAGANLYKVDDGTHGFTLIGALGTVNTGAAQIVSNGKQLLIYDGGTTDMAGAANGNAWLYDGTSITKVLERVVGIAYLDGYFIALRSAGDGSADPVPVNTLNQTQVNLSDLFDGSTWDPLQFAIRSGGADQVQMIVADHEELWLFGSQTTEIWYDTGGTVQNPFPLQRVPGAFITQGLYAPASVVSVENSLMFFGGDPRGAGVVWQMNGYIPVRVSNHAFEFAVQNFIEQGVDLSSAVAYAYQDQGHIFYSISFPGTSGLCTWIYDLTTKMWHERSFSGVNNLSLAYFHAELRFHFVGGYGSGNLYIQAIQNLDDAGMPITRLRASPHISIEKMKNSINRLQLDFGGPFNVDRHFTLSISKDGGFTFPTPHAVTFPAANVGSGPQYQRAIWRRLGQARDFVVQITTTDAVEQAWVDCYAETKQGIEATSLAGM